VSGGGLLTQQELQQLQFLWLQGREAARAHIVQTVANDPLFLLHLPRGMDRDEVMDLIGEFPSCFVCPSVCY
jgi:hypothetical protein